MTIVKIAHSAPRFNNDEAAILLGRVRPGAATPSNEVNKEGSNEEILV